VEPMLDDVRVAAHHVEGFLALHRSAEMVADQLRNHVLALHQRQQQDNHRGRSGEAQPEPEGKRAPMLSYCCPKARLESVRRGRTNRRVSHRALQQEQLAPAGAALVASVKVRSHSSRLELGQLSVDFRTQGLEGWAAHLSPPWSMPPSAASVCSETSSWARARASRERTVPTGHST